MVSEEEWRQVALLILSDRAAESEESAAATADGFQTRVQFSGSATECASPRLVSPPHCLHCLYCLPSHSTTRARDEDATTCRYGKYIKSVLTAIEDENSEFLLSTEDDY